MAKPKTQDERFEAAMEKMSEAADKLIIAEKRILALETQINRSGRTVLPGKQDPTKKNAKSGDGA